MGRVSQEPQPAPLVCRLPPTSTPLSLVREGGTWAVLMARNPKPRLERALVPIWDILSADERRALLRMGDLPRDYRPVIDRPPSRQQRLEGIRELDRIMRQKPGRIGQLREDLLLRVEPDECGE